MKKIVLILVLILLVSFFVFNYDKEKIFNKENKDGLKNTVQEQNTNKQLVQKNDTEKKVQELYNSNDSYLDEMEDYSKLELNIEKILDSYYKDIVVDEKYEDSLDNIIDILKYSIKDNKRVSDREINKYLYSLATFYYFFSYDIKVLDTIYIKEYFKYKNPKYPNKTAANMLRDGYWNLYPSARITTASAGFLMNQLLFQKIYNSSDFEKNKKEYLNKIDKHFKQGLEIANKQEFVYKGERGDYKIWSSFVKAGLNLIDESLYKNWSEIYLKNIEKIKSSKKKSYHNILILKNLYLHLTYFTYLENKNDENIDFYVDNIIKYDKQYPTLKFTYKNKKDLDKKELRSDFLFEMFFELMNNNKKFRDYIEKGI